MRQRINFLHAIARFLFRAIAWFLITIGAASIVVAVGVATILIVDLAIAYPYFGAILGTAIGVLGIRRVVHWANCRDDSRHVLTPRDVP